MFFGLTLNWQSAARAGLATGGRIPFPIRLRKDFDDNACGLHYNPAIGINFAEE